MFSTPSRQEIDHRTIKLIIGIIAISLGFITSILSHDTITSISASYWQDGSARNIFVGFLFIISALMLAYNGERKNEMLLSKGAAIAALGVALFQCSCDGHTETIPHIHYVSAGVMFIILDYFCYIFYDRAKSKGHTEAKRRTLIYALCGLAITLAMAAMAINYIGQEWLANIFHRFTYYCEFAGLAAFGISWLVASKIIPSLSAPHERINPFA